MRIGIFTNAYKPEISGVIKSISTYRAELVRQGHTVYIFAPETPDYEDEEYDVFRYPAIKLPASVSYPMAIPVSPYIDWLVPRLKLDVIHSQHPILIGEEAITFARKCQIPHIFTHHTQYEEYSHYIPFNENIVKTLTREIVRAHLLRSVKIVLPTESMRAQLNPIYPEIKDRFEVLPTPIPLDEFEPGVLNPQPIQEKYNLADKFVFSCVSRLTPEKNMETLLEAFATIANEASEARLLMVGDGPSRKSLTKLSQTLNIADKVIFTGLVDYHEVPHHLAATHAFAFASTTETQGLVMVEGMAAGLPVVAVDGPGNRDVVVNEVNGLLVENNISAMTNGMRRLLKDKDLYHALQEEALKTAQEYTPHNLAGQLVSLYEEAIESYQENPITYKFFKSELEHARNFPPQWLADITGKSDQFLDSLVSFWQKLGS